MIKKLIKDALSAIESEIDAVRERPSSDTLLNGTPEKGKVEEHIYSFQGFQQGLRFAEEVTALYHGKELKVSVVDVKEKHILISFPEDMGPIIDQVYVEWENDFVLKKIKSELTELSYQYDLPTQVQALFEPSDHVHIEDNSVPPEEDGLRNEAQREALEKALSNNILYVWGPPGTGKTSTLGFIIANYLKHGKRVLFVSNTNRAVDVGLLDTLDALEYIDPQFDQSTLTRFGDAALQDERLDPILFEYQTSQKLDSKKEEAAQLSATLSQYHQLQEAIDGLLDEEKEVPESLELQIQLLGEKLDQKGGPKKVEARIEKLQSISERYELMKRQLIGTTLAKVCTSDLFYELEFDAVVVDEASMAGLHYMLIMAGKSTEHMVVVGDPMQLPPIAMTDDLKAKEFLEKDVFTYVSGASKTEDLFKWHDDNPSFTCFFEMQYRLKSDLAGVISSVFYDGRLLTSADKIVEEGVSTSVALVDTSRYQPTIVQERSDYGFRPVNEAHLRLVEESVRRLSAKYHPDEIGVIAPFRNSVYTHRKQLSEAGYDYIEVGTIHTFQGREKDVIIFDTVMSAEMQNGMPRHYSVRPFDETKNGLSVPRLLNVAFSRSKQMLVIIADMHHIDQVYGNKFLGRLLRSIKEISL